MQYESTTCLKQDMLSSRIECFDQYIVAHVHRFKPHYASIVHPAVLDLEIDELTQRVRIKFWQALEKRDIHYPAAYIRLIIRNEFVNIVRRQKSLLPLPDSEECLYSDAVIPKDQPASDPADEVEQKEAAIICLRKVVQAVLALPPRQRFAMICMLRERVDDLAQLTAAFKACKVDIEPIRWPTNKMERQLLQASLVPARRAIAKNMQSWRS